MTQINDNYSAAFFYAGINAFILAVMSLFAKLSGEFLGPIEITFARNIFAVTALFIWLLYSRNLSVLKTKRPFAHLIRGAIGTTGIVLGMWALTIMPLAETIILLFTAPLFAVFLSFTLLREKIGLVRLSAALFGFLGVLIMVNPFGENLHVPLLGLITGLGWGFFAGAVDTCLRWIGSTEKSTTTVFYFTLFGAIMTGLHLPFATFQPDSFSWESIAIMLALGLAGLGTLLTKTQSYRLAPASLIAPVMYTMIIWAVLFDYFIWDRTPSWNTLAGGAIIIGSNLFIMYREKVKQGIIKHDTLT